MTAAKAPTPGTTNPSAFYHGIGIGGELHLGTHMLDGAHDRTHVAGVSGQDDDFLHTGMSLPAVSRGELSVAVVEKLGAGVSISTPPTALATTPHNIGRLDVT